MSDLLRIPGRIAVVAVVGALSSGAFADEADWLARSTAPGVMLATNFNVESDVTGWIHDKSGTNFADSLRNVSWFTGNKASGAGSLRMNILASDGAGSGQWVRWMNENWDDGNFDQGFKTGDQFYVQVRMYHPASYVNQRFHNASDEVPIGGTKFMIISNFWQSNRLYEVVPTDNKERKMFQGYNRDSNHNYPGWDEPINDDRCGMVPDLVVQPEIDLGPQNVGTPCENMRAQYGGLVSYDARQGAVDGTPDPLSPVVKIEANKWKTLLINVQVGTFNLPTSQGGSAARDTRIRYWVAGPGEDYVLLKDNYIDLGSEGGGTGDNANAYNAVWLLPYGTGRAPFMGEPVRTDTYVLYDELIVSTNFIPAPGMPASSGDTLAPAAPSGVEAD